MNRLSDCQTVRLSHYEKGTTNATSDNQPNIPLHRLILSCSTTPIHSIGSSSSTSSTSRGRQWRGCRRWQGLQRHPVVLFLILLVLVVLGQLSRGGLGGRPQGLQGARQKLPRRRRLGVCLHTRTQGTGDNNSSKQAQATVVGVVKERHFR